MYDTKYHLVWIPRYRKNILNKEIAECLKQVFKEIAQQFEFEIDTMEVMKDHMHIFLFTPLKYSPARIVQIMKSISAKRVFRRFPHLEDLLWNKEFRSDGYFVRTVEDKVTTEAIQGIFSINTD